MSQIRVHRLVVATLVAAVLATAPTLAAPPRSTAPSSVPPAALVGAGADATAPLLSLVSADPAWSGAMFTAGTTSHGPSAAPEHRLTVDPNG